MIIKTQINATRKQDAKTPQQKLAIETKQGPKH